MRVLVTGSSGRIGAAVARQLAPHCEVFGLDCLQGEATRHLGDIRDDALLDRATRGMDAVIHVAALHAPHVGVASEQDFREVNVGATQNLLAAALRHGVRRFVLTSTTSVYGCSTRRTGRATWVTESLQPQPEDIYDETKLAAEAALASACGAAMSGVVLRMSRCFPEAAGLEAFYRLFRGVDQRDVARAHELALNVPIAGHEVLNISSQTPFKEADCAELYSDPWVVIERYLPGARRRFLARGWELPASIDRVYSVDRARSILDYQPKYGFFDALEEAA